VDWRPLSVLFLGVGLLLLDTGSSIAGIMLAAGLPIILVLGFAFIRSGQKRKAPGLGGLSTTVAAVLERFPEARAAVLEGLKAERVKT